MGGPDGGGCWSSSADLARPRQRGGGGSGRRGGRRLEVEDEGVGGRR